MITGCEFFDDNTNYAPTSPMLNLSQSSATSKQTYPRFAPGDVPGLVVYADLLPHHIGGESYGIWMMNAKWYGSPGEVISERTVHMVADEVGFGIAAISESFLLEVFEAASDQYRKSRDTSIWEYQPGLVLTFYPADDETLGYYDLEQDVEGRVLAGSLQDLTEQIGLQWHPVLDPPESVGASIHVGDPFDSASTANYALDFDGKDDYVDVENSNSLDHSQRDFTIEAWVYLNSSGRSGYQPVISNRGTIDRGKQAGISFFVSGSSSARKRTVGFEIHNRSRGNSRIYGTTSLQSGTWYHVAVTYLYKGENQNIGEIYVNGELENTVTLSDILDPETSSTFIGLDPGDSRSTAHFSGQIDEIRFWDVARSQGEIQTDMTKTLFGDRVGLVSSWSFDEGEGTIAHDATGQNNGTIVGDPRWILSTAF